MGVEPADRINWLRDLNDRVMMNGQQSKCAQETNYTDSSEFSKCSVSAISGLDYNLCVVSNEWQTLSHHLPNPVTYAVSSRGTVREARQTILNVE